MRGSKPGERRGGRQRGTKNKLTLLRERAHAETGQKIAKVLGPDAFDGDAHAFLVAVFKDPSQPMALRLDAAKAAIGYEKPRLASVDGNFDAQFSFSNIIKRAMQNAEPMKILEGEVVK